MSSINEFLSARDEYIARVKEELLGPGSEISIPDAEHELITNSPDVRYSIGILFPKNNKLNADNNDPSRVEESSEPSEDFLEEEELLQVFRLVNNYLYPGGVFIFDFNTVYKYREVIGNTTIAENREDCSFIWENYYDPEEEINEYDLTIFVQEEEDIFRRFTETHLQRGYTVEQMRALLEQAGLKVLEIMDSDTGEAATATSERVYIVAKEQQKELPTERYVK